VDRYQGKVQVDTGTVPLAGVGMVDHMVAADMVDHMAAVDMMEGILPKGVGMLAAEVVDIL
jgi:hypothetical protein